MMKMNKRYSLIIALGLALAASAEDAVRMKADWNDRRTGAAGVRAAVFYFMPDGLYIDTTSFTAPDKSAVFCKADTGQMTYIDYAQKETLSLPTGEDLQSVTGWMDDLLDQTIGRDDQPRVTAVRKTQDAAHINGMPARRFTVAMTGPHREDLWLTTPDAAGLPTSSYRQLKEVLTMYQALGSVQNRLPGLDPDLFLSVEALVKTDGLPVRWEHRTDGRVMYRLDVHPAERIAIENPEAYRIPRGFARGSLW